MLLMSEEGQRRAAIQRERQHFLAGTLAMGAFMACVYLVLWTVVAKAGTQRGGGDLRRRTQTQPPLVEETGGIQCGLAGTFCVAVQMACGPHTEKTPRLHRLPFLESKGSMELTEESRK